MSLIVAGVTPLVGVKVSQLKAVGVAVMVNGSAEPLDDTIWTVLVTGGDVLGA